MLFFVDFNDKVCSNFYDDEFVANYGHFTSLMEVIAIALYTVYNLTFQNG